METAIKIVGMILLAIAASIFIGYVCNRVTPDQAREINYLDYGSWDGNLKYNGYRLDEFMEACGAYNFYFLKDQAATITCEINDWYLKIENFTMVTEKDEACQGTQVLLTNKKSGVAYAFGRVRNAEPPPKEQPEMVFVRDHYYRQPWRQPIEKAVLEDLIAVMTSGELLEKTDDPLSRLNIHYVKLSTLESKA